MANINKIKVDNVIYDIEDASVDAKDNAVLNEAKKYVDEKNEGVAGELNAAIGNKVDKENGKGLSTNDFTTEEKTKLSNLSNYNDTELRGLINNKAEKSELNNYVTNEALNNKGYLTDIPSEYITETELTGKGYATTTDVENAVKDKATTNYVDTKVANLVNAAPETLDTLGEVATAIQNNASVVEALNSAIGNKVDKVSGKGLSTNDYTTEEKNKLSGLSNYDDTEVRGLIDGKVDKVSGKGLSTNDYTTTEKNKLAGLKNYDDTELKNQINSIINEVPSYVKSEAKTVANNVTNVRDAYSFVFGAISDLHTNGTTLSYNSILHAGQGMNEINKILE